ncbi:hypothetical protein [Streptomyces sp. 2224.1]|uniref:hypothetical protein n=1 Tax=Streptomyces sp. 2224.1 TaxID=1881020 RepID=UPI000B819FD6|nr:hypothetical protein [Streptomyces sp. 2224.1]
MWLREDRDTWKKTVQAAGGRPLLVYLPVEKSELLRRLDQRNQPVGEANALTVPPEALDDFFARFEPRADDENTVDAALAGR